MRPVSAFWSRLGKLRKSHETNEQNGQEMDNAEVSASSVQPEPVAITVGNGEEIVVQNPVSET